MHVLQILVAHWLKIAILEVEPDSGTIILVLRVKKLNVQTDQVPFYKMALNTENPVKANRFPWLVNDH